MRFSRGRSIPARRAIYNLFLFNPEALEGP
jgi:hypothetical protein